MRWRSAEQEGQVVLFDDVVERHIGRGEFRGMEFLHVNARRIINEVPRSSPVPFRYKYRLTRGIVEALAEARNPFSILTKSTLILRDLDVLAEAASHTDVRADLSIGTLDEHVWRTTEPGTPHPRRRVEAVARLNAAGIPCGVLVAPVLPGLSDAPEQVEAVVKACVDAGAVSIAAVLLHLRPGVREHWFEWLHRERPDLVDEHDRLYTRAYAPKARQQELSQLVGGLLRRYDHRSTSKQRSRYIDVPAPAAPRRPAARQLPLDL